MQILYLGAKRGLETKLLESTELPIDLRVLEICGLQRPKRFMQLFPSIGRNIMAVGKFLVATQVAKKHLAAWKPEVLIGTGGYVSAPAVYAAHALQIPVLLHEQNTHPGLTTRLLSRYADSVAISWEETREHLPKARQVILTGNPRATEVVDADAIEGRRRLKIPSGSPTVLFVGGSQGADRINQAVQGLLPQFMERPEVNFVYVTGERYYDQFKQALQEAEDPSNVIAVPYVHQMPDLMAAASLVVTRAGATTLAELMSLGVPSILIPSPIATNDHQTFNAKLLEAQGASFLLPDAECTSEQLWERIEKVLEDPACHREMRRAAKSMGHPYAAIVMMDLLEKLIKDGKEAIHGS